MSLRAMADQTAGRLINRCCPGALTVGRDVDLVVSAPTDEADRGMAAVRSRTGETSGNARVPVVREANSAVLRMTDHANGSFEPKTSEECFSPDNPLHGHAPRQPVLGFQSWPFSSMM